MSLTNTTLTRAEALRALASWELPGPPAAIELGSGTANASVILRWGDRELLLKRRNPRYAREQWVRFDHALMAHLSGRGIPVPVALPTRGGQKWAVAGGEVYELYPFMPGDQHRAGDERQVLAAGEMLGRFHLASADFEPPSDKSWDQYHSPAAIVEGLARITALGRLPDDQQAETLRAAEKLGRELLDRLPDEAYWSLPATIVHGDWHPANLKFTGERVAGVFDLDWCTRQPRMVDLADGLLFFCGRRREPLIAGDIWSLTESFEMDSALVTAFGAGYISAVTPTDRELRALPDLMRCRWLYCRVDAAIRKVEPERRAEFVTRDLLGPLAWLDRDQGRIADGSALGLRPG